MTYTLLATGDLMVQRPIVRADEPGLRAIFDLLAGADHSFANLEQALTDRGEPADKLSRQRATPSLAAELPRAGVRVVTVANNHAMDFGAVGMRDTLSAVRGAGVACVGGGEDLEESLTPAVLKANGLRVAFLGLSCTLANSVGADRGRPGLAPVRVLTRYVADPVLLQETPGVAAYVETEVMPGDSERAAVAVTRAKEAADLVIVGIHWGVPHGWAPGNQDELATYQRPLAHTLINAGADAIVGHHPHVLHGVEIYSDRPIFYSLGNFLFHTPTEPPMVGRPFPPYSWQTLRTDLTRHGGIARLVWDDRGRRPEVHLIPIWLDAHGEPSLSSEEQSRAALAQVSQTSEKFGTPLRLVREGAGMVVAVG